MRERVRRDAIFIDEKVYGLQQRGCYRGEWIATNETREGKANNRRVEFVRTS
jgi:hypothetical protein